MYNYDEADHKPALASVGVPCGKSHSSLDGKTELCQQGSLCCDCQQAAAECLALLRHC